LKRAKIEERRNENAHPIPSQANNDGSRIRDGPKNA
jgi:hypothetical protein